MLLQGFQKNVNVTDPALKRSEPQLLSEDEDANRREYE